MRKPEGPELHSEGDGQSTGRLVRWTLAVREMAKRGRVTGGGGRAVIQVRRVEGRN